MNSTIRKAAFVAGAVGAACALGSPMAFASSSASISPANTAETASSTSATFNGSIDGIAITVTCTGFSGMGTTPSSGLTVSLPKPPTYSGCSDNSGGSDTITTDGTWTITAASNGKSLEIVVPKAGATFTSSVLPGCTITVAPKAPAKLKGTYNDKDTLTLSGTKFATAGSGCSAGSTSTVSQVVTFSPGFSVVK